MIPHLETERLILREDCAEDFDAFAGFMADADFTRFIGATAHRPSQRVAEKLGETKGPRAEVQVRGRAFAMDIWSIAREDWRKKVL
jgi:RimJ/RimL family protein N-acetyltransferase